MNRPAVRSVALAFGSVAVTACIGVSQTPYYGPNAPKLTVDRCPDAVPAVDGLIDDFEDGNGQLMTMGEREGYWWIAHDTLGATVIEPSGGNFQPTDGGYNGSALAAHVKGHVVAKGDQAWGIQLGGNFLGGKAGLYDASRYAGISFVAKAGEPNALKDIRVSISDVNTHQDAGVCTQCWNHFGSDITLTPEWKQYRILFADMRQAPGWGDPRPAHITPSKVLGIAFSAGGGKVDADVDLWVDDLQFLACKPKN